MVKICELDDKVLEDAVAHISSADVIMSGVFKVCGELTVPDRILDFTALFRIILNQQLSGKAATTIYNRVTGILGKVDAHSVAAASETELRSCGISLLKVGFAKALAHKCLADKSYLDNLHLLDDESAAKEIRSNKGFGEWSASVILLFHLRRCNLFPYGDGTLSSAIRELYGINPSDRDQLSQVVGKWSPYGGVASMALWQWVDRGRPAINPGGYEGGPHALGELSR